MSPETFADEYRVSRETLTRLLAYQALLGRWQQRINLVGPATLEDFWNRHAADSAQLLALAEDRRVWLDLGSGGGFLDLSWRLCWLKPVVTCIWLKATGARRRFAHSYPRGGRARKRAQSACRRACDGRESFWQMWGPLVRAPWRPAGIIGAGGAVFQFIHNCLLHKGAGWQDELTRAEQCWNIDAEVHPSRTHDAARILRLRHLSRRGGAS